MRMRRAVLAAAWLCAIGPAAAARGAIRTETLANGMTAVYVPDPRAAAVDVSVTYLVGIGDLAPAAAGARPALEWLLANGTSRSGVADAGGVTGASSSPDLIASWSTVPPSGLGAAIQSEATRMRGLAAQDAPVRAAIRAAREQARIERTNSDRLRGLLYGTAFAGHPYARAGARAAGPEPTVETVRAAARAMGPARAAVMVVGRFDVDSARALVRRTFGAVARRSPVATPAPAATSPRAVRSASASLPGANPVLMAAWRAPAAPTAKAAALEVLARALAGGPDGRLNAVRGGKAFLFTEARVDRLEDATLFYLTAVLPSAADTAEAMTFLQEQVQGLGREPLSAAELAGASRQVEMGWRLVDQSVRGRAAELGAAWARGEALDGLERRYERLAALTPAELQQIAAELAKVPQSRITFRPTTALQVPPLEEEAAP